MAVVSKSTLVMDYNWYFSVEFIGYYLDRNVRLTSMKAKLEELLEVNNKLQNEQQMLRYKYDQVSDIWSLYSQLP
jgi:hypothetical protein